MCKKDKPPEDLLDLLKVRFRFVLQDTLENVFAMREKQLHGMQLCTHL